MAIDNFQNRGSEVMIPQYKASAIGGFGVESIQYHLGGTFRGTYYTLNDNIINGRIRGIAGVVGCNNARTRHNEAHIAVVKELIKNDVIVLTTGCNGIACAMEGLLTPESAAVHCGPGWPRSARPWVSRRSCTWAPAWTTAASCWRPPKWSKPAAWAKTSATCPQPAAAPEWMSEKAISIGHYFRRLRCLHGLRPAPAHLRRPGVPRLHLQRDGKDVRRHVGSGSRSHQTCPHDDCPHRQKTQELGIDKARERVLMDMADRQALEG
jgi:carbon-monoxide dehydrogenase catalytic subunit